MTPKSGSLFYIKIHDDIKKIDFYRLHSPHSTLSMEVYHFICALCEKDTVLCGISC